MNRDLRDQVRYWRLRALKAEKRELIFARRAGELQERLRVLRALAEVLVEGVNERGDPGAHSETWGEES